jgi:hypothetical protein
MHADENDEQRKLPTLREARSEGELSRSGGMELNVLPPITSVAASSATIGCEFDRENEQKSWFLAGIVEPEGILGIFGKNDLQWWKCRV